jgi:uncharacterized protein (DUF952 family)/nucleoside 2-deoxyribosyltransferase
MVGARVYVASPLGFSEPGRRYLHEVLHPALVAGGFVVLDPWADPDGTTAASLALASDDPGRHAALTALNARLGAANAASIESADAVLAVLDGSDVDSGTAAEIGFAAARGRLIVGLRTDTRETGDNEAAVVNLQILYFIEISGGRVITTVADAVAALSAASTHPGASAEGVYEAGNRYIYHLTFRSAWERALQSGEYRLSTRGVTLDEAGFIHASFAHQVAATAAHFFDDVDADELVVLQIDRSLLQIPLLIEENPSTGELFPHIYGPLAPEAVIALLPPP